MTRQSKMRAKKSGQSVKVPFAPGRTDASQAQTDVPLFAPLEPVADGFRNYVPRDLEGSAASLLLRQGAIADLHCAGNDCLVGGSRAWEQTYGKSQLGVFTKSPGVLTNDFFVNLLDMRTKWQKAENGWRRA